VPDWLLWSIMLIEQPRGNYLSVNVLSNLFIKNLRRAGARRMGDTIQIWLALQIKDPLPFFTVG